MIIGFRRVMGARPSEGVWVVTMGAAIVSDALVVLLTSIVMSAVATIDRLHLETRDTAPTFNGDVWLTAQILQRKLGSADQAGAKACCKRRLE